MFYSIAILASQDVRVCVFNRGSTLSDRFCCVFSILVFGTPAPLSNTGKATKDTCSK